MALNRRLVSVTMLPVMLKHDRKRAGRSVGQAAWRLGVSVREYRLTAATQASSAEAIHRS